MGMVSQKLRDSAKGQPCMFRIPFCCNSDPSTTVFCHAPDESKGMGNKAHDFIGAFGCSSCHTFMDQRFGDVVQRDAYWFKAITRTVTWWVENGYLRIVGDGEERKPRAQKLSKIVPHSGKMRR